jgi:hypothetical protein
MMSKTYTAVVKNGAIHIETPELEDGTVAKIEVQVLSPNESGTIFEQLEKIKVSGLPNDFSITHKPKENND